MSDNHNKTNSQPQYGAQVGEHGLLLRLTIFIGWVIVLGLLIWWVACHHNESVIFIIKVGST